MEQLLGSSVGLLPLGISDDVCTASLLGLKGGGGGLSPMPHPIDFASCLAVTQAIEAALLPEDPLELEGSNALLPLSLFGDPHKDDWGFAETSGKSMESASGLGICAVSARASRLSAFAFLEGSPDSPCHHPERLLHPPIKMALDLLADPPTIPAAPNEHLHHHPQFLPAEFHKFPHQHPQFTPSSRPFAGLPPQFAAPNTSALARLPASDPPLELERQATQIIVEYLSDPAINPYKGSVPLERIQNIFRGKHADLYQQVVGSKHSAWKKYIQRNSDIFQQFSVEEGKWRMRLLCHNDWQEGDQKEEAARVAWETHFTTVLVAYLDTMADKVSSLDAFMAAYKDLPQTQEAPGATYDLPHRGDLVRFIRRSARFSYDQGSFQISFRIEGDAPKEAAVATKEAKESGLRREGSSEEEGKPSVAKLKKLDASMPYFGIVHPSPGAYTGASEHKDPLTPEHMAHTFIASAPYNPYFQPAYYPPPLGAPYSMGLPAYAAPMMVFPPEPPLGSSPGSPAPPAEIEQRATQIIAGYLLDASINPYQGSVPVERIQNLFRSRNPELYDQVVGSKHSAWKRYIERNSDIFSIFPIEEGKWRMRLLCHQDWKTGDQKEEAARDAWEQHFTAVLLMYLQNCTEQSSTLDDFMAAYPAMPQSKAQAGDRGELYTLPHRGDLVRFLRRSTVFTYDQASFLISLRPIREAAAEKVAEKPAKAGETKLNPFAPCFRPKADLHIDG